MVHSSRRTGVIADEPGAGRFSRQPLAAVASVVARHKPPFLFDSIKQRRCLGVELTVENDELVEISKNPTGDCRASMVRRARRGSPVTRGLQKLQGCCRTGTFGFWNLPVVARCDVPEAARPATLSCELALRDLPSNGATLWSQARCSAHAGEQPVGVRREDSPACLERVLVSAVAGNR